MSQHCNKGNAWAHLIHCISVFQCPFTWARLLHCISVPTSPENVCCSVFQYPRHLSTFIVLYFSAPVPPRTTRDGEHLRDGAPAVVATGRWGGARHSCYALLQVTPQSLFKYKACTRKLQYKALFRHSTDKVQRCFPTLHSWSQSSVLTLYSHSIKLCPDSL